MFDLNADIYAYLLYVHVFMDPYTNFYIYIKYANKINFSTFIKKNSKV